ncbi:MAG TPA: gamma-glutamyltransferase family protein [Usitatibacter sp.]|nr:gamma-glutamyltransferase family protein [Usitatibacter sp.]
MKFRLLAIALLALSAACTSVPRHGPPLDAGVGATPRIAQTANPMATRAALDMLDRGGNAVDAIVAAQMVLGLAEPQMSGIGGGTLIIYRDAATNRLETFDGLAAAPAHTTASLRTDVDGTLLSAEAVRHGGRSVAVPGTLPVLAEIHRRHGKLPWSALFEPAIALAERGFPIPEYLHRIIVLDDITPGKYPDLRMFFDASGEPLAIGTIVRNPEYAQTLRRIAARGIDGWLGDGGAERIVEAAHRGDLPTLMTPQDLRDYRPVERDPICAPFLAYRVCTVPPPSYGGVFLLQALQMLQARSDGRYDLGDASFVHLYVETGKLARADRAAWVGDPAFGKVPTAGLVSPAYARERAASIDAGHANPSPRAGRPPGTAAMRNPNPELSMGGTSQLTVADATGNVVAMTTTINLGFGARLMVDGYVLNDALTNFSAAPKPGQSRANAMEPGKRPFTSMAPAIVLDKDGNVVAAGGSAGGGPIPDYLVQGWIDLLVHGMTPAEAVRQGHVSTATVGKVVVEKGTPAAQLADGLRARGHEVVIGPLLSGAGYIERAGGGWIGAADPRRGGNAAGN